MFEKKYDYDQMRQEFINGPWMKVNEYLEEKGLAKSVYLKTKMKGWDEEKYRQQKSNVKAMENNDIGKIVPVAGRVELANNPRILSERQAKLGRLLQHRGLRTLETIEPETADEARKLIETGINIERKALGLDGQASKVPGSLTQVNVNLPKTKFDDMLDKLDYEGLIKLLANIRRERTRRAGESGENQSSQNT
ncbi:MAG: hypothetical protein WC549_00180 [Actinomycetota bacterium]